MQPWRGALPFFPEHELRCKGSGIILLDPRFAAKLPALRQDWGTGLTPNSVCRSPEHNANVNGHPRSLHLTQNPHHPTLGTMAADLAWRGWHHRRQLALARLAWSTGWAVGLHDGFIHVDLRGELGLERQVFLYGTWTGAFGPDDVRSPA